jgi:hypothetical protein
MTTLNMYPDNISVAFSDGDTDLNATDSPIFVPYAKNE